MLAAVSAPASASFLDTDFWCRTYGCAVVHDGQTYDIYDIWQFSTGSCCVAPGGEMVSYYSRAGVPLVTGTLDRVGPGAGNGESLMLEVVDGSGVYNFVDDGDGFLDASDSLGAFSLGSDTDVQLSSDKRRYSHSFYITSRNTRFSIHAFAQIDQAVGELADNISLGEIKLTPTLASRGNDEGWDYGSRANSGNVRIVNTINDLGDLSAGPTQFIEFGERQGIRLRNGNINDQLMRLDFAYELPQYDMSMGAGELSINVEFAIFREP